MSHTPVRVRAPLHSLPIPQLADRSPSSSPATTLEHAAVKSTHANAFDSSPSRGKAEGGDGARGSDSGSGSVSKRQRLSDGSGVAATGSGAMPSSPAPVAAQAAHAWAAAPSTAQQQQQQQQQSAAWGCFKREPASADSKAQLPQPARARACLIPPMPGMDIAPDMAPPFRTAFDMMQDEKPLLSLGDEYLDAPLQGGVGEGITELVGESACGKTQIGMQLLLQCQLPKSEGGLNGGALFIAMEGEFPISRLRSMAQSFQHRHPKIRDPLNKVYIKTLNTPEELSMVLHHSLRPSLEKGDVKLVVLDSIAAMFRAEHSGQEQDFTKRSQDFLSIAAQLKQLSSTFHVPVVVINQVSDFFAGADGNGGEALSIDQVKHSYLHHWSMMSSGRRVVPALGLTWANCVNTRIFLTRRHEFVQPVYAPAQGRGLMQPLPPTAGEPSVYNPLVNRFTGAGAGAGVRANPTPQFGGGGMQLLPQQQLQQQSAFPQQEIEPPPTRMRRFLHVQFSPHLPPATAEFLIETAGIRGTSNLDDVQLSPTGSPAAGSGWQKDETPTSGIPQLQPLNAGFSAAAAAPAVPTPTPQSYFHNMYTPSGSAGAGAAAPSPNASPHSRLDADEAGRTEEDERQELLMLERVEAEMRQRQQAQLAQQKLQTFSSPPQTFSMSPQQQQPTQWRPSPPQRQQQQQQQQQQLSSMWSHSPPQSF